MSGEKLLQSSASDEWKIVCKETRSICEHARSHPKKIGSLLVALLTGGLLAAALMIVRLRNNTHERWGFPRDEWDMQCDAGFSVSKFVIRQWNREKESATFQVEKVQREKPAFKSSSLLEAAQGLEYHWEHETHEKIPIVFEAGQVNHRELVSSDSFWHDSKYRHGFISTVVLAYNKHLALVLSPDDFWLMISLAVGQFLGGQKEMAEKYRYKFVNHTGQKLLMVDAGPYGIVPNNPQANVLGWPGAVKEMTELIANETSTNIAEIMTTPFSTSGHVEMMVMRVTLMETMKNYFTYGFYLGCGIPEVTLEGNPGDYKSIIDRICCIGLLRPNCGNCLTDQQPMIYSSTGVIIKLRHIRIDRLSEVLPDFQWYLNRVRQLMIKIHESRLGKVDQEWWKKMISGHARHDVCTITTTFTGWLAQFVAFTRNARGEYICTRGKGAIKFHECCGNPAVTMTDFFLHDQQYTMKRYDMKLAAGFMGTALARNGSAIRPASYWMGHILLERTKLSMI